MYMCPRSICVRVCMLMLGCARRCSGDTDAERGCVCVCFDALLCGFSFALCGVPKCVFISCRKINRPQFNTITVLYTVKYLVQYMLYISSSIYVVYANFCMFCVCAEHKENAAMLMPHSEWICFLGIVHEFRRCPRSTLSFYMYNYDRLNREHRNWLYSTLCSGYTAVLCNNMQLEWTY